MNPLVFVLRRPVRTLLLVVALVGGGVLVLPKMCVRPVECIWKAA